MNHFDLGALARAAEAKVVGGALPKSVSAVGTDTRSLPPDSLFVALRGERFDGHEFASNAVARGATALLVDRQGAASGALPSTVGCLVVEDTLRALGDMAQWLRTQKSAPVVAVTGSNGKTSTKELIAAALSGRGPVHKTAGNFNNLIGLPLTVFAWPEKAWAAVLEMGMNVPGEIDRLTEIAAPTVGVITNVGAAHLQGLGSVQAIARAKGELFGRLDPTAAAVINADDALINDIALPLLPQGVRQVSFGTAAHADVRLASVRQEPNHLLLEFALGSEHHGCTLPLVGRHQAYNAAAALAVAVALDLPLDLALQGLQLASLPRGRFALLPQKARGVVVVDDTYNANPASMKAAFDTLHDIAKGRKIAVLGCMFELGAESAAWHQSVGEAAASKGFEWVLAYGPEAEELALGARRAGAVAHAFTGELNELIEELDHGLHPGDWVLVKGSRSMQMERVVHHLQGDG